MITVKLTKPQLEQADWALDAMMNFAGSEDADYSEVDLPRIEGRTLVFPTDSIEAAQDILYLTNTKIELGDKIREAFAAAGRPIPAEERMPFDFPSENPGSLSMGPAAAIVVGLAAVIYAATK